MKDRELFDSAIEAIRKDALQNYSKACEYSKNLTNSSDAKKKRFKVVVEGTELRVDNMRTYAANGRNSDFSAYPKWFGEYYLYEGVKYQNYQWINHMHDVMVRVRAEGGLLPRTQNDDLHIDQSGILLKVVRERDELDRKDANMTPEEWESTRLSREKQQQRDRAEIRKRHGKLEPR